MSVARKSCCTWCLLIAGLLLAAFEASFVALWTDSEDCACRGRSCNQCSFTTNASIICATQAALTLFLALSPLVPDRRVQLAAVVLQLAHLLDYDILGAVTPGYRRDESFCRDDDCFPQAAWVCFALVPAWAHLSVHVSALVASSEQRTRRP